MTAKAMTPLSVMAGAERLSLESPVPSTGHAGCGGGREETYWSPGTRLAPILPFVERLNLSLRQHMAAIGRRTSTLCKGEDGLRQQLAVSHAYYNFCLPHTSLRQALPHPVPTNATGSAKQWRPCTPAMRAGLTDRVWTLREVLLYRVPPRPQPQAR
jgi:hypothetical protein